MSLRTLVPAATLLALLGSISLPVIAQPRLLQRITVNEGLSQNTVYRMFQDSRGFMWIGTADGLNRYDGYAITVYRHTPHDSTSLPGNDIRDIAEGSDGTLWVSTQRGVVRFDRRRAVFVKVRPEYAAALLVDRRGILWMGTAGYGLFSYDPSTGRTRQYTQEQHDAAAISSNAVLALAESPDGTLWVATEGGLDAMRRGRDTVEHIRNQVMSSLTTMRATSMVVTPDGYLWIGTMGAGLIRFNQSSGTALRIRATRVDARSLPSDTILTVSSDSVGNLWLGTFRGGALCTDREVATFQRIPTTHPWGTRVCVDRSGLVWVGTDGFGVEVHTLQPPKFQLVGLFPDESRGPGGEFLKAVYEDRDGTVWIGSYGNGITLWDRSRNRFRHLTSRASGLRGKSVYAISSDSTGRIWVGTEDGLNLYERNAGTFRFFPSMHSRSALRSLVPQPSCVNTIAADPNGDLWIGTNSGFEVFDTHFLRYTSHLAEWNWPPGTTSTWTNTIFRDGDSLLWIGTQYSGLLRCDRATRTVRTFTHSPRETTSISSRAIKVIHRDSRDRLWIGTELGLNLANEGAGTFTRFFDVDGLPSSYIYGILEDGKGNLWISSNHGITRFAPDTRRMRNYDRDDGLQSNEFNTGAYFENSSGEMYFGGINGLNLFHPDSVRDNPHVPRVVLTGFKKFDVPSALEADASEVKEILLRFDESVFSLQFAALEYTAPLKNQYAYMLEGFESNWIFAGTRREVRYTSLPPGGYVFRVKASNGDGIWNEQGLAIRIVIVPPFWRSWWFLTLCGLAALGTVGGSIRYIEMRKLKRKIAHLEQQETVQRERVRISRDMHDELGASLTRISLLAGIAGAPGRPEEEIRNELRKIEATSRDVVQRLDEVVWMVNPKNDTLESLAAYVAEYAEQFFAESPIRCRFDFPTVLPAASLPAETRRNIFLTIKEALNNALKHSGAEMVSLQLSLNHDAFRFVIHDNGRGFHTAIQGGLGNGLGNMKRRVEEIGGHFSLTSIPEGGTTVTVQVRLPAR
jgi:ligand-binding sensor domain-containing protein/two-component sensor histidine kinase